MLTYKDYLPIARRMHFFQVTYLSPGRFICDSSCPNTTMGRSRTQEGALAEAVKQVAIELMERDKKKFGLNSTGNKK